MIAELNVVVVVGVMVGSGAAVSVAGAESLPITFLILIDQLKNVIVVLTSHIMIIVRDCLAFGCYLVIVLCYYNI